MFITFITCSSPRSSQAAVSLTRVSLVLVSCSGPVSDLPEPEHTNRVRNRLEIRAAQTEQTDHRSSGRTNLPQSVSFAERLVRHVLELLWDGAGAPSGRVVLDDRGVKLRHDLTSKQTDGLSVLHFNNQQIDLRMARVSDRSSTHFSSNELKHRALIRLRSGLIITDPWRSGRSLLWFKLEIFSTNGLN